MVTWQNERPGNWSATHEVVLDGAEGPEESTLYLHVELAGANLFGDDGDADGLYHWHLFFFDACGTASAYLDEGACATLEDAKLLCAAAAAVVLGQDAAGLQQSIAQANA